MLDEWVPITDEEWEQMAPLERARIARAWNLELDRRIDAQLHRLMHELLRLKELRCPARRSEDLRSFFSDTKRGIEEQLHHRKRL